MLYLMRALCSGARSVCMCRAPSLVLSGLSAHKELWLSAEPLRSSVPLSKVEKLFFLLSGRKTCSNPDPDRVGVVQQAATLGTNKDSRQVLAGKKSALHHAAKYTVLYGCARAAQQFQPYAHLRTRL